MKKLTSHSAYVSKTRNVFNVCFIWNHYQIWSKDNCYNQNLLILKIRKSQHFLSRRNAQDRWMIDWPTRRHNIGQNMKLLSLYFFQIRACFIPCDCPMRYVIWTLEAVFTTKYFKLLRMFLFQNVLLPRFLRFLGVVTLISLINRVVQDYTKYNR